MIYNACDGQHFFQTFHKIKGDEKIFISIATKKASVENIDFAFIKNIMDNLMEYQLQANNFLIEACNNSPMDFGFKEVPKSLGIGNVVSDPELTFREGKHWSILFREGLLPICYPYGILVNFQGNRVLNYEKLMDFDEI